MNIIVLLLSSLPLAYIDYYILTVFTGKKLSLKKRILVIILFIIMLITNGLFINKSIRPVFTYIYVLFISYIYFNRSIKKSFIDSFIVFFLTAICEVLCVIILMLIINNDIVAFTSSNVGIIVANFLTSLIMYFIAVLKTTIKLLRNFKKNSYTLKSIQIIQLLSVLFVTFYTVFFVFYYKFYFNEIILYVFFSILFMIYTFIIFTCIRVVDRGNRIYNKYLISLSDLNEYEKILTKYRVDVHEHKNHLQLLRQMDNIDDIKKYISTLLKNKEIENKDLVRTTSCIPESGIRSVIYTKMLVMNNKKINNSLVLESKLVAQDFKNFDSNDLLDICNIINVFLDNAIESSSEIDDPKVLIEISKDENNLLFCFSNNFKNIINLDEIKRAGYTTKGGTHGYGLTLVNNIIKSNKLFKNETYIDKNIFTQILYIKLKK